MNKEQIFNYLEDAELLIARARASVFICDLYFSEYAKTTAVGKALSPVMAFIEDENGFQITEKRGPADLMGELYKKYQKDKDVVQKMQRKHLWYKEKIDTIWPGEKALESYSNKELLQRFNELLKFTRESTTQDAICEDKGLFVEENLVPILAKNNGLSISVANSILGDLSHPEIPAVFNQEKQLFLEICLLLETESGREKVDLKVEEYLSKYFWFESNFYENIKVTRDGLIRKAENYTREHGVGAIENELNNLAGTLRRLQVDKKRILKEHHFSQEDKEIIRFVAEVSYWSDLRKALMMEKFYYTYGFVYEIGRRFDLGKKQVVGLRVDQLLDLLRGKNIGVKEVIEQNKKIVMYFNKEGEKLFLYGDDFERVREIIERKRNKKEQLKGMVASKGEGTDVEGVVKVLNAPHDDDFTKENILVTSMTRVEFVPLMRIAKAIITDEGGISCHAAIVSRELGVPCVIGTQRATAILKTGDKVRMNLETGEIIKL